MRSRLTAVSTLLFAGIVAFGLLLGVCARDRGPRGAAGSAPGLAGPDAAGPAVEMRLVPIYQRALTDDVQLQAVDGQIVWVESVGQRAQQIVRLVLEGFPAAREVVAPAASGVRVRALFLDRAQTVWVDFDGETLGLIVGSDEEESLIATVARSLVDGLQEVRAVAFLVDGKPAPTLAGHVDLTRRFTGREWPVVGQARPSDLTEGTR